jgi:hypothetical protein
MANFAPPLMGLSYLVVVTTSLPQELVAITFDCTCELFKKTSIGTSTS